MRQLTSLSTASSLTALTSGPYVRVRVCVSARTRTRGRPWTISYVQRGERCALLARGCVEHTARGWRGRLCYPSNTQQHNSSTTLLNTSEEELRMAEAAVMDKASQKGTRIQVYAPPWMVWQLEQLGDVEDSIHYVARDMVLAGLVERTGKSAREMQAEYLRAQAEALESE